MREKVNSQIRQWGESSKARGSQNRDELSSDPFLEGLS